MLQIREEQLAIFDAIAADRFQRKLRAHCRAHWAEQCSALDDEALAARLVTFAQRAAAVGLIQELHVMEFVNLLFVWGADCDSNPQLPWIARTLQNTVLSADEKIVVLRGTTKRELARHESLTVRAK